MRIIASAFVLLLLSACALPLGVTIASYSATGFSFVATGKGLGDHALSEIVGMDCAMLRLVQQEAVCVEFEEDGTAIAEADPTAFKRIPRNETGEIWPAFEEDYRRPLATQRAPGPKDAASDVAEASVAVDEPGVASRASEPIVLAAAPSVVTTDATSPDTAPGTLPAPVREESLSAPVSVASVTAGDAPRADPAGDSVVVAESGAQLAMAVPRESEPAAAEPASGMPMPVASAATDLATTPSALYVVLGSFAQRANAERTAAAHGGLPASIKPAEVAGKIYHRVVAGPYKPVAAKQVKRQVAASGVANAWLVTM